MYCNNCGSRLTDDARFCQQCGEKIIKPDSNEDSQNSHHQTTQSISESSTDSLWDKFTEVYDAKDEARRKFNVLSSNYIWELLNRLATNAFESFIQDNKEELNKQPYKTIESLKDTYTWSVIGGYRLWLAEALLDDKEELNNFKSFSLDKFIEKWKDYDFDKATKALSDEIGACIAKYMDFRFSSFIEAIPEAKELPNETIEKLKTSLLYQVVNGYHAGKVENMFRK